MFTVQIKALVHCTYSVFYITIKYICKKSKYAQINVLHLFQSWATECEYFIYDWLEFIYYNASTTNRDPKVWIHFSVKIIIQKIV